MVSGVSTVVLSAMMAGFVAIPATVVIERRRGIGNGGDDADHHPPREPRYLVRGCG